MNRQSTMQQHLESVNDLTKLPNISDDIVVACLRDRFMTDVIYTNIGSSCLVAINPHKHVASNADLVLHKYAAEYRNTTLKKELQPPHIFQLANNAYYHMKRTTQDQVIVFSGETGSGKSESRCLAIKSILELSVSNPGTKGSKLSSQVPAADFVLESFGNARTLVNPNASRFGKYTELHFSDFGQLTGAKTLEYYLERNRVVGAPSGERNFHIFYYLIAGASQEERAHLHLDDKTQYRYLEQRPGATAPRGGTANDDDSLRFEQLKVALKTIGFSKRHVAQTSQLLAAILHLGNLEFTVDRHRNEDAAVVRNTEVCRIVADLCGVQQSELEACLSYKSKLVEKEMCTIPLDPDSASNNRDELAKVLYSLLFAWLNEHINQCLCTDDFSTFLALFDLPGPQNTTSRPNSLDQFCINFANERLHHWTQQKLFESHLPEYQSEGIASYAPQVTYFDNAGCVHLLQNEPGGLVHIMDDQAKRAPNKTNHTMVEAFQNRWGNHSSFRTGSIDRSGYPTFTIHHFNGPVTYSSENFLERNQHELNSDFVSLLRGGAGDAGAVGVSSGRVAEGSINPFVKGLFSGKAIAVQAHPHNEETIVGAQQNLKPMRAPSSWRKRTIRRMPAVHESADMMVDESESPFGKDNEAATKPGECVAGEFRAALDTLFKMLDEPQAWHVFCINPNDSQLPNQLEGRNVKGQVRSFGLVEIAKRCGVVFEVNMTPEKFCERYGEGMAKVGVMEGTKKERVQQARTAFGLESMDIVPGKQQVYLSQVAFHLLEDQLRSHDIEEQQCNRMQDAEAKARPGPRGLTDPYARYHSPGLDDAKGGDPCADGYDDAFTASSQQLPLISNASPFFCADQCDGGYDNNHSLAPERASLLPSPHQKTGRGLRTKAKDVGRSALEDRRTRKEDIEAEAILPLAGREPEEIRCLTTEEAVRRVEQLIEDFPSEKHSASCTFFVNRDDIKKLCDDLEGLRPKVWAQEVQGDPQVFQVTVTVAGMVHALGLGGLETMLESAINLHFCDTNFGLHTTPYLSLFTKLGSANTKFGENGEKGCFAPDGQLRPKNRHTELPGAHVWEYSVSQPAKEAILRIAEWMKHPAVLSAFHMDLTGEGDDRVATLSFYRKPSEEQLGGEAKVRDPEKLSDLEKRLKELKQDRKDMYLAEYVALGLGEDVILPVWRFRWKQSESRTKFTELEGKWDLSLTDCFIHPDKLEWIKTKLGHQAALIKDEMPKQVKDKVDENKNWVPITSDLFHEFSEEVFSTVEWKYDDDETVNQRKQREEEITRERNELVKRRRLNQSPCSRPHDIEYQAIGGGNIENSTTSGIGEIIDQKQSADETGVQGNASEDEPRFLICNDHTQKETPYKAANIVGVVEKA
ncbi:hypothetical protein PQX77_002096 [Marasmius sp. AFHP31]|nr:hypothetical protein PQX77_002096 [Marasmius sp. AFHP31]